jgi:hypothetical protein
MNATNTDTMTRPSCPECGSHDISEIASTRVEYSIVAIDEGRPETGGGWTAADGEFGGFICRICFHRSDEIADFVAPDPDFEPQYEWWRHGGWLVLGVRHKNGGVGCVSRNYPDRKWRIVCDSRGDEHTYKNRDEAARAEYALTLAGVIE